MKQSTRNGFTLVELLVVIAIIAVLAGILFPVFVQAKRAANRTTALNNFKQIGMGVHLYLNDYDDTLPPRFPMIPKWPGYNAIIFLIGDKGLSAKFEPYIKNSNVWYSPEDRLQNKGYTSFSFNEQLAFVWPMSSIPRPTEAIYMTDRTDVPGPFMGAPDTYAWWQFTDQDPFTEASLPGTIDPVSVATQIDPIRYVGNNAIYLFLDSHAKALPFGRTWGDAARNLHLATKS